MMLLIKSYFIHSSKIANKVRRLKVQNIKTNRSFTQELENPVRTCLSLLHSTFKSAGLLQQLCIIHILQKYQKTKLDYSLNLNFSNHCRKRYFFFLANEDSPILSRSSCSVPRFMRRKYSSHPIFKLLLFIIFCFRFFCCSMGEDNSVQITRVGTNYCCQRRCQH